MRILTQSTPMSRDQLKNVAPAIFATEKHESRSDRYVFMPTINVIEALEIGGWYPRSANQVAKGKGKYAGHNTQRVVMQHPELEGNDEALQLIVTASHHGRTPLKFDGGIGVYLCSNGLMMVRDYFHKASHKHIHCTFESVLKEGLRFVAAMKDEWKVIEKMKATEVEFQAGNNVNFLQSALKLRWANNSAPINIAELNNARRYEDVGPTVWKLYNRVQENLIKGGQGYVQQVKPFTKNGVEYNIQRQMVTKPIIDLKKADYINKSLWTMAERLAA